MGRRKKKVDGRKADGKEELKVQEYVCKNDVSEKLEYLERQMNNLYREFTRFRMNRNDKLNEKEKNFKMTDIYMRWMNHQTMYHDKEKLSGYPFKPVKQYSSAINSREFFLSFQPYYDLHLCWDFLIDSKYYYTSITSHILYTIYIYIYRSPPKQIQELYMATTD